MNRYSKGKIYKIVDVGYNKCYVGSTCESLSKRMERHRNSDNQYLQGKYNKARSFELFDEFGVENCKILLLQDYPCENKEQLRAKEGEYQQKMNCINKYLAGRTKQQYYQDYAEHFKKLNKIDYEKNKDKYLEQRKNYHQDNREFENQRSREYYHQNKEAFKLKKTKVEMCQCGSHYTYGHKARHLKSKKHQDWQKQQEEE